MRRLFLAVSLFLLLASTLAQGSISGTLAGSSTAGYVLIACLPDDVEGCDWAASGFTNVGSAGDRAPFSIDGLAAGQYVLIAWLDANGNEAAEEDELEFLLAADGQPVLVSPPASGIEFRLSGTRAPNDTVEAPVGQGSGVPAEFVGIWQQTRATSGDYRNTFTGHEFTATSGFNVELVIGSDASFYFAYYSSGTQSNCSLQVTYFEQARGSVAVSGNRLVLSPVEHRLDVGGCSTPGTFDLGPAAIVYAFTMSESFDSAGLRGFHLALEGGPHPLDLELLHREPLMPGFQPAQPQDFVLGDVAVYSEFVGTWAPDGGSDLGFYQPETGSFYLPEYNGSPHLWLRFDESRYALARAWRDYNFEGICTKDYVFYESGSPTLAITRPAEYDGDATVGHARFKATTAHLIVNIQGCDEYSEVLRYQLVPQTSYYTWRYRPETNDIVHIPEGLSFTCAWQKSEWQFMVCDDWDPVGLLRR
ncbi:MAG TPA: hypothetical protein VFN03_13210 [Trueperaceae bacterium]|nr:hypothetical protein [Trueperaceae bacterium]